MCPYALAYLGIMIFLPAPTHRGDGFKAAWGQLVGASEAAIHCPV